jgi:regulator of replication initiation timing
MKTGTHYERMAYKCQIDKARLERRLEFLMNENEKLRQNNQRLRKKLENREETTGPDVKEQPSTQRRIKGAPTTW